jgi:hypothetical protein
MKLVHEEYLPQSHNMYARYFWVLTDKYICVISNLFKLSPLEPQAGSYSNFVPCYETLRLYTSQLANFV